MMDTPQSLIELAKEGMELSAIFLLVRLGLKRLTIEERYHLNIRADRYHRLTEMLK